MVKYQRKYQYPNEFITKKGTLNKNKKKQVNQWIQNIKNNTSNSYNNLQIENFNLKIENNNLKKDNKSLKSTNIFLNSQIKDYSFALEDWVLYAQSFLKF